MGTLLDYLRLLRAANVFTALADVMMGYACVQRSLVPLPPLAGLLAASALLYLAGMVLNDVFDIDVDRRERPQRPLPAGRIALRTARILGWTLLLAGLAAGWLTAVVVTPLGRSGFVATLLAGCILLYDAGVKSTPLGPLLMGTCRGLNVLLGASLGETPGAGDVVLMFPGYVLVAATGMGVYVAGVTWYARREAEASEGWHLAGAILVMLAGIAGLGLLHRNFPPGFGPALPERWWLLMLALLGLPIARRCVMTVADPVPARVQAAVKQCLLSIIVLDAAVTFTVGNWYDAVIVLSLLVPAALLGRWVYST
jgi:4-hydroxybenzoate polyprenyltransferase